MAWSDGVFNPWTFSIQPNTIIPIAPNAQGIFPLQPLPDTANPQFLQLTAQDLRIQINKLMYADPLEPIRDKPTRTATELSIRQNNLAEEIGPAFTRLQQEFLSRLIQRCIYILQKRGLMEPIIINGHEVQIKYKSPLVIEQGTSNLKSFITYFQTVQAVVGENEAKMFIKPHEVPPWIAEQLHIDKRLYNSVDEMLQMLSAENEKREEIDELQMGEAYAGINREVSELGGLQGV